MWIFAERTGDFIFKRSSSSSGIIQLPLLFYPAHFSFSRLHLSIYSVSTLEAAQPVLGKLLIHHFLQLLQQEKAMD